jgi:hypothetical protein
MPPSQTALFAGPGRYPALALYRPRGTRPEQVRARAAALLAEVEQLGLSTEHILVAVSPRALVGHPNQPQTPDIRPADPGNGFEFEFDAAREIAVLVQVSAETPEDRVHALRLVRSVLEEGRKLRLVEELLGDVRTHYREPFGYPDGRKAGYDDDVTNAALIAGGPLAGGSWVFYQRLVHDFEKFFGESATERDAIVGIDTAGNTAGSPPSQAGTQGHVILSRRVNRDAATGRPLIMRRSFPYRAANGDEGLVFIGATSLPVRFKVILQAMLGGASADAHDAILQYVDAVKGGLFFVPPDAAWLLAGQQAPATQVPEHVRDIQRPADQALQLYPFTPEALAYMNRIRDRLIYGDPVGWIDRVPNPDDEIGTAVASLLLTTGQQVHDAIAGGYTLDANAVLTKLGDALTDYASVPKHIRDNDVPDEVKALITALEGAANAGPLTVASVTAAASGTLQPAVLAANVAIQSGVGAVPAPARDLINCTDQVVTGSVPGDPTIATELGDLLDASIAASERINQSQGYYITIQG